MQAGDKEPSCLYLKGLVGTVKRAGFSGMVRSITDALDFMYEV